MKTYDSDEYLKNELNKAYLEIVKENNVSSQTIQLNLKKFGSIRRTSNWAPKEIIMLKNNYGKITNFQKVLPNRTKSSIYHKANKLGLTSNIRYRQNLVNENFFNILTKESAYVLGWIFSDGNITKDKRTFGFHLNKKDINVLKLLKKVMESNHKIFFGENNDIQLRIHSRKMVKSLLERGLMPDKTFKIKFPKLSEKYLTHFVRGYFEGDGSIHFNKPNTIKIKIMGNKEFIQQMEISLNDLLKISGKLYKHNKMYFTEYYGNNARSFCRWVYKNCDDLYLERKYKRFVNHMKIRGKDLNGL